MSQSVNYVMVYPMAQGVSQQQLQQQQQIRQLQQRRLQQHRMQQQQMLQQQQLQLQQQQKQILLRRGAQPQYVLVNAQGRRVPVVMSKMPATHVSAIPGQVGQAVTGVVQVPGSRAQRVGEQNSLSPLAVPLDSKASSDASSSSSGGSKSAESQSEAKSDSPAAKSKPASQSDSAIPSHGSTQHIMRPMLVSPKYRLMTVQTPQSAAASMTLGSPQHASMSAKLDVSRWTVRHAREEQRLRALAKAHAQQLAVISQKLRYMLSIKRRVLEKKQSQSAHSVKEPGEPPEQAVSPKQQSSRRRSSSARAQEDAGPPRKRRCVTRSERRDGAADDESDTSRPPSVPPSEDDERLQALLSQLSVFQSPRNVLRQLAQDTLRDSKSTSSQSHSRRSTTGSEQASVDLDQFFSDDYSSRRPASAGAAADASSSGSDRVVARPVSARKRSRESLHQRRPRTPDSASSDGQVRGFVTAATDPPLASLRTNKSESEVPATRAPMPVLSAHLSQVPASRPPAQARVPTPQPAQSPSESPAVNRDSG